MNTTINIAPKSVSVGQRPAHSLELAAYVEAVAQEGASFAATAESGDLNAPIAACPGWDLRELVKHVGLVHLWAAANIAYPSDGWLSVDDMSDLTAYWPEHTTGWPPDTDLVAWYRSTLALLVEVMEATPEDHQCLTFLPAPSPLVMWARRQASEIAVHRFDAATAAGVTANFDASFADDMLDELLNGFAPRMRARGVDEEFHVNVSATDVDAQYAITIDSNGVVVASGAHREHVNQLSITGTAADLYVLMWNRPAGPSVRMDGDLRALDAWRDSCRIEWI